MQVRNIKQFVQLVVNLHFVLKHYSIRHMAARENGNYEKEAMVF